MAALKITAKEHVSLRDLEHQLLDEQMRLALPTPRREGETESEHFARARAEKSTIKNYLELLRFTIDGLQRGNVTWK